ncbi:MAG: hypothetical protein KJO85_05950, partial [Gammaproteobacteria bacterium]|nr:hypothetical protein [Gammaproteobacteria bacterium]
IRPLRVDMLAARFHRGGPSERRHGQTLLEEHRVRCHYFPYKRWISPAVMGLKRVLQYFSRFPALRRLWRKRI